MVLTVSSNTSIEDSELQSTQVAASTNRRSCCASTLENSRMNCIMAQHHNTLSKFSQQQDMFLKFCNNENEINNDAAAAATIQMEIDAKKIDFEERNDAAESLKDVVESVSVSVEAAGAILVDTTGVNVNVTPEEIIEAIVAEQIERKNEIIENEIMHHHHHHHHLIEKTLSHKVLQLNNLNDDDNDDNQHFNEVSRKQFWNLWNYFQQDKSQIEEIESKIFGGVRSTVTRKYINIRNNSQRIWTMSTNTSCKNPPIVLVHGYCGGSALWLHNIDSLSNTNPLYAIDLIGFGRSSRPAFSADPIVAEAQFVESIEDWRKEVGLSDMILIGHSFGAFIATSYALKYPQKTKSVILVDPWGFPENTNVNKLDTPTPIWIRCLTNISNYLNPLNVFRATGPIGGQLFKYLKPDFKTKYTNILENSDLIYDYMFECNKLYPSGEKGFKSISEYYGFAKNPMIKRVDRIDRSISMHFVYGSRSWLDSTPGFMTKYLRNRIAEVTVEIISGAGHHVYADKPDLFNKYIGELVGTINKIEAFKKTIKD